MTERCQAHPPLRLARDAASRPARRGRTILRRGAAAVRAGRLRRHDDGGGRGGGRRRAEDGLRRVRDQERRCCGRSGTCCCAATRTTCRCRSGRWYREVLDEPDPERQLRLDGAQLARRQAARRRAAEGDPRRARSADADIAALWQPDPDRSSTTTSAGLVEVLHERGHLRPGLDVAARDRHRCGRSTTPTCGTCSSASAAGRRRVRAVVSPTPPARSRRRRRTPVQRRRPSDRRPSSLP